MQRSSDRRPANVPALNIPPDVITDVWAPDAETQRESQEEAAVANSEDE